jgi:hypothetical protein
MKVVDDPFFEYLTKTKNKKLKRKIRFAAYMFTIDCL